jgi:hypothetical protein
MMYKKIIYIITILLLAYSFRTFGQNTDNDKPAVTFGGYINWTGVYDSRQTVSLREGQFLLYPANAQKDQFGMDINDKDNFNFLSVQTRLNAKIEGLEAFGAATNGFVEGEFFGTSDGDANGFRLRHAYVEFKWTNSKLVLGQTWHPMFISDAFPQVISFNTGVPFQPFSRNPQIKFIQTFNTISFQTVLYSQRDFTSNGPNGYSSSYLKNSAIPAVDFQFRINSKPILLGVGIDYKVLTPRIETTKKIATENTIKSFAGMAYFKYSQPLFSFIAEGIYGQNMTDLMMLGGYAVSKVDSVSGEETYTNIDAFSLWADVSYGKEFQVGLFAGYSENLGSDDEIVGKNYSRAENLGQLFRIAPRVQYTIGKMKMGCELEFTQAEYGTPDIYGKISNGQKINNTRFLIGLFYNI